MVVMHSTSSTTAKNLLDLFSSSECNETVEALREESDRVLREASGAWIRETVMKPHRTDSKIRESMRRSGFGIAALPRMVSLPQGLPIHEHTISRGTQLAVGHAPGARRHSLLLGPRHIKRIPLLPLGRARRDIQQGAARQPRRRGYAFGRRGRESTRRPRLVRHDHLGPLPFIRLWPIRLPGPLLCYPRDEDPACVDFKEL